MSETFRGRSFVVGFYLTIVALTGAIGAVLGAVGPEDLTPVKLLGVVTLQPTPLGLAVYGVVTVGIALGIPLALVVVVSEVADAESAEET
ncbi:cox cluster protein [Halorussus gelatinilyticus]|uniref:Cox cluster protein n=1 Tax=Halorussus gelatinilyticus TaxID=2937524 RepID=A0A8U0IHK8_9EURY|nr:cox cluster protein [Halorussus gelatinilyticus]UPV99568.1 cox cluster protein [Halorussus gelatinilyticus]